MISGDEATGRTYVTVAKAMNIIGPLLTLFAIIFVIVYLGVIIGSIF